MTRFPWLIAAAAFAGLAGAAQGQKSMSPQAFEAAAAQSDLYEIQAGRLVVTQSENAQVRAFGQQMIDDHTRISQGLEQAANASGLQPPDKTLGSDQQRMLSALQSMKGPDLDKAYVTQQFNAHTSALVTAQAYAASGSDANLRKAAQAAVPVIQHHLEMARQMKTRLDAS